MNLQNAAGTCQWQTFFLNIKLYQRQNIAGKNHAKYSLLFNGDIRCWINELLLFIWP